MHHSVFMKIFTASINVTVGDWPTSLRLICECIDEAIKHKCTIIAFAELTLGGMDARDYLKCITNTQICSYLRLIAAYAYKRDAELTIFIGHPWQGFSADAKSEQPKLPHTKRDKLWNAYSCLSLGEIIGMSLKQNLDTYLSRLEERDYVDAKKIGVTTITLPETVTFSDTGKKIVTPQTSIPAGNIVLPIKTDVQIYPVIGDQTFLNESSINEIKQHLGLKDKNCIILNPTATPSSNKINSQHNQLIEITRHLANTYIRINGFGGMNNGQGDILACASGRIITRISSATLTEKFTTVVDTDNHTENSVTFTPEILTMRSQVRWLFDYLTNTKTKKVGIVLPYTGDLVSTYHLYLIYLMVSWYKQDIGIDKLLSALGMEKEKEIIIAESEKTSLEQSILSRLLTCIFLDHDPNNFSEKHEIKKIVNAIGGKLISHDTTPLVDGVIQLIQTPKTSRNLSDLHDLSSTVMALSISNIEQSISIANLTIDDLILRPRFGGKIHQGQISPSSSLYRNELFTLMNSLLEEHIPEKNILKNILQRYKTIYANQDEKFKKTVISSLYGNIDKPSKSIKKLYTQWQKAQYAIHASPLTLNHNQQAIDHNTGLRMPNFFGSTNYSVKVKIKKKKYKLLNTEKKTLKNIKLKITQASCNQTAIDWENNLNNIFYAIDVAVENKSDLLALAELSLTGYDCGDLFFSIKNAKIQSLLYDIINYAEKKDPNLLISIGHPWWLESHNKPFNVQSLLGKGSAGDARILMMKFKSDLYGEERGFERRHFSCEIDNDATTMITIPATKKNPEYNIPFGRKVVARIGNSEQGYFDLFQSICEEYWKRSRYDDDSGKYYEQLNIIGEIKNSGYNIGLYVTAHASPPSPNKIYKQYYLTSLASTHGQKNMLVIHTDNLGSSGSSYVNPGTRYVAQNGKIIVDAPGVYSLMNVAHNTGTYDVSFANLLGPPADTICHHVFNNADSSIKNILYPDAWRQTKTHELESAIRNQLLFIYDIMRKSRVRCFTQALSGGADSAWNVVKIRLMIELGVKELGVHDFLRSLHYPEKTINKIISKKNIIECIMKHTVLCYYLATKNNSPETENAARYLIESGIGGTFLKFNIQPLIEKSYSLLSYPTGVTAENIQARIRQMITSFLTRLLSESPELIADIVPETLIENLDVGACFGISNPNENEGRRGYTTFGGDLHSGEINFNGHVPKDEQLKQMHFIYEHGLFGLQPITALKYILEQTPSAELQPKNEKNQVIQTDENSLGLTFTEATTINHARITLSNPRKIFDLCRNNPIFTSQSISTIHDKIYITYHGFSIALHKLISAPNMQTYGEFTTSAKSSMQYPLISMNERYELAQLTLYCLNELAVDQGINFITLTGYTLDASCARAMLNERFAFDLHNALYMPESNDGRPYKLDILYKKVLEKKFLLAQLFEKNILD